MATRTLKEGGEGSTSRSLWRQGRAMALLLVVQEGLSEEATLRQQLCGVRGEGDPCARSREQEAGWPWWRAGRRHPRQPQGAHVSLGVGDAPGRAVMDGEGPRAEAGAGVGAGVAGRLRPGAAKLGDKPGAGGRVQVCLGRASRSPASQM